MPPEKQKKAIKKEHDPGGNTETKIKALETVIENDFLKRIFRNRNDVTSMLNTVVIWGLMSKVIFVELSYDIPRTINLHVIGIQINDVPIVMFYVGSTTLLQICVNFTKEIAEIILERMKHHKEELK